LRVSVVRLRRAGLRLRPHELESATVGELTLRQREQTSFKRLVSVAELTETYGNSPRMVIVPLFDPVLVHVDADGFSLVGIELEPADGRVREHAQVWRCRPMNRSSPSIASDVEVAGLATRPRASMQLGRHGL